LDRHREARSAVAVQGASVRTAPLDRPAAKRLVMTP